MESSYVQRRVGADGSYGSWIMTDIEENTVVVERHEGLWRVLVYPNGVHTFGARTLAEGFAREVAYSRTPPWTVVVREPKLD